MLVRVVRGKILSNYLPRTIFMLLNQVKLHTPIFPPVISVFEGGDCVGGAGAGGGQSASQYAVAD